MNRGSYGSNDEGTRDGVGSIKRMGNRWFASSFMFYMPSDTPGNMGQFDSRGEGQNPRKAGQVYNKYRPSYAVG